MQELLERDEYRRGAVSGRPAPEQSHDRGDELTTKVDKLAKVSK